MASNELTELTLTGAKAGLAAGDFTAEELTRAHLEAVEAVAGLNAWVTPTPEIALERAQESDKRLAAGEAGPMEGLPIGIKDLFCTQGVRSTAASVILGDFVPPYESTVTANLRRDGAVMLGKLNMDEFAMGSATTASHFGPTVSPWSEREGTRYVAGGSSGGSAAAVAARSCLAATGTDTGGSIRQPASYCGVVGLKPTYGRCSRWGMIAFASSLDQAGPITRTVADAALMLGSMAGVDAKDSTSVDREVPDFTQALTGDVRGLKVGLPREYRMEGMPAEIDALWQRGAAWLRAAGAEPVEISLPHTRYALPAYYIIAPAEASSNLARYDGVRYGLRVEPEEGGLHDMYRATRAAGFGAEVRRRVMIGTYVLSAGYYDAYYLKAQKVRSLIARDFEQAFETVDAVLAPTAPSQAFVLGEKEDDPVQMYLNDVFTVPASLSGLPGLSVPAGLAADGLPLGLQLIGRPFDEATVLRLGGVLEEAAGFSARPPQAAAPAAAA